MATKVIDSVSTESLSEAVLRTREKPNHWFGKCTKKLQSIAQLGDNWDSYGSKQPSSLSLNYAHAFLHFLRNGVNVDEPLISPNAEGNICFEWEDDTRFLTTEIDDGGNHHYYYCYGDAEEIESETIDSSQVLRMLTKL